MRICEILVITDWWLFTYLTTRQSGGKIRDDNSQEQLCLGKLISFDDCFVEVYSLGVIDDKS